MDKDLFSDDNQDLNDDIWDQPWGLDPMEMTPWEDSEDELLEEILEEVFEDEDE